MDFRLLLWVKHWSLWREHCVFVKPKLQEGQHAKMFKHLCSQPLSSHRLSATCWFHTHQQTPPISSRKHYASIRFNSCFDFREPQRKAMYFGWKPEIEPDDNNCMKSVISCCVEILGCPYSTSLSQKLFISKCEFLFVGLQKYIYRRHTKKNQICTLFCTFIYVSDSINSFLLNMKYNARTCNLFMQCSYIST